MTQPVSPVQLPAVGPLSRLGAEDRSMLASYGHFQYFETAAQIIRQGEPQNCLYLVLSGTLHARRTEEGRDVLVGEIRTGESIGEVSIFDPSTASASVFAVGPVQLWKLDASALADYLGLYPIQGVSLLEGLATILARRLRAVNDKLAEKAEYQQLLASLALT